MGSRRSLGNAQGSRILFTAAFAGTGKSVSLRAMPKKKEPELTPEEQIKRFKEAAKKAGVTNKEEEFERAFKRVAPSASTPKKGRDNRG
jgi:hypothetical protein